MQKLFTKSGKPLSLVGLGTFPFQGEEMAKNVEQAVALGYNVIDTADDYRGESGIGIAVNRGLFKREDLFLQTKISNNTAYADEPLAGIFFNKYSSVMHRHTVDEIVREKISNSLREMNTDYIDSVLIHYPYPNYYIEIWKTLICLQTEGVVRYIGCSNFHKKHIVELIAETGVAPKINEIYISPIGSKKDDVEYALQNNIQLMTYSPLMDIACNRIPLDIIKQIAQKYNKTVAQVILRWNVERGSIPLPKTKNPKRLAENNNIDDFSLEKAEIEAISSLNYDYQYLPESRICPGI